MAPPLKTDAQKLAEAEEIVRRRGAEINALTNQLRAINNEKDTAEAIRRKIFGLAEFTPEPPEWTFGRGVKNGERGGPVLMISDLHYGEVIEPDQIGGVNEYNSKIAAKRLQKLVVTTIDLCQNHMGRANVKYPGIVVCLGGDLIGGDIHEELMITNDKTSQQSVQECTNLIAAALHTLADFFGKVFVVSVVGNHGRTTRKPQSKNRVFTNYDWTIACNLERHFQGYDDPFSGKRIKGHDQNVRFQIPNEADAYFSVFGTRFLLTHGDALGTKGGDGIIGALGPITRGVIKLGNSVKQIGRDFDYCLMGHWHELYWLPSTIVNGCIKGFDEYAHTQLRARYQPPQQALFFVHPEHGMTARWPIFLEPKRSTRTEKTWVSWQS